MEIYVYIYIYIKSEKKTLKQLVLYSLYLSLFAYFLWVPLKFFFLIN